MTKHMGSNALAFECRALFGSSICMFGNEALDGIPAEPVTAIAYEQRRIGVTGLLRQPIAENHHTIFSEWSGSLLSSFAHTADVGTCSKHYITTVEVNQFRDPETRLQAEQKQGSVASSTLGG